MCKTIAPLDNAVSRQLRIVVECVTIEDVLAVLGVLLNMIRLTPYVVHDVHNIPITATIALARSRSMTHDEPHRRSLRAGYSFQIGRAHV